MKKPNRKKISHIHFMGIGGSGMSAVAAIAKSRGFIVSGCDSNIRSDHIKQVKKLKIPLKEGHSQDHLRNCDLLVVTPAVLFSDPLHSEFAQAREKHISLTWQEFMGKFLHENKKLICVAGTHGKSTTTAMLGLVLEAAGADPTVELGANVKKWGANYRLGKSRLFVSEADEFNNNFLSYAPQIVILNNIEFDHPEYFSSIEEVEASFYSFLERLTGEKSLIFNSDHEPTKTFIQKHLNGLKGMGVNTYSYRTKGETVKFSEREYVAKITSQSTDGTTFTVSLKSEPESISLGQYKLSVPGLHNVSNAMGVIAASQLLGIDPKKVQRTLLSFTTPSRRLEEVAVKAGIKIVSDYAHHPSEVKASLEAAKQKYRDRNLWVVFQPHMFARLKMFLPQFAKELSQASRITLLPVFAAREQVSSGITSKDLADLISNKKTRFTHSFEEAANEIGADARAGDVIILMGAGDVNQLKDQILKKL